MIPQQNFDTPVCYEHLLELGSFMGSGGMIVMDEDDCLVDIAKFYLGFCVDESCGKCAPCRIGGFQMLHVLKKITDGKGTPEDLDIVSSEIARRPCGRRRCARWARARPIPIISTMKNFAEEYRQHIVDRKCRAGKCTKLMQYVYQQRRVQTMQIVRGKLPGPLHLGRQGKGIRYRPGQMHQVRTLL